MTSLIFRSHLNVFCLVDLKLPYIVFPGSKVCQNLKQTIFTEEKKFICVSFHQKIKSVNENSKQSLQLKFCLIKLGGGETGSMYVQS